MINTEGLSAADLAAVLGNNNGDGFNGNGAWWLLILLIFANNGWGNNGGFGGNATRNEGLRALLSYNNLSVIISPAFFRSK